MELTSSAFKHNEYIPSKYTCDGANISPPLKIENVPENTEVLALVMDDPDAPMGVFDHWVVWNIPKDTKEIPEGTEPVGVQGRNDFGKLGYGGPCPPYGVHNYRFKLYALDKRIDLPEGSTKKDLEEAMKGHIIQEALLIGKYKRI